jgi:predicted transposase/invertase (TIGR01784 family)
MKNNVQNHHDKIVKETFSRPEIAKRYFEQFLPTQLSNIIDIDSLQIVNSSYVTADFKDLFADLLFQFNLKNTSDSIIISLLFEHKARPDKNVLIQVGNYIFNQWSKEIKSKQSIIPIIPLIYYQGKKKWIVPTIQDLFKDYPTEIKSYLPSFDFIFFAISSLTKEQLGAITETMLLIALLGHNPNVDIISFLKQLSDIQSLNNLKDVDRNFINHIFVYKINNSDLSKDDIFALIKDLPNPINKEFMSTYDAIKLEGEQIGLSKAKSEVVIALFGDKIPIEQIAKYTNLTIEEIKKIVLLD